MKFPRLFDGTFPNQHAAKISYINYGGRIGTIAQTILSTSLPKHLMYVHHPNLQHDKMLDYAQTCTMPEEGKKALHTSQNTFPNSLGKGGCIQALTYTRCFPASTGVKTGGFLGAAMIRQFKAKSMLRGSRRKPFYQSTGYLKHGEIEARRGSVHH